MTDQRSGGLPPQVPTIDDPPSFVERRRALRRTEDRVANQEKLLLARALDVLVSDSTAEERLAGLLRLLARTVGARRAAVVADGIERRAAVAVDPEEDPAMAEALAVWLDAHAPRTRAHRVVAARAPISFIVAAVAGADDEIHGAAETDSGGEPGRIVAHYAVVPIPSAGDVALGFEFRRPADAERLADRLPPTLARHAAVALA